MPRDPQWARAFGAEVQAARRYAELTQGELAERVHCSRSTISLIEGGRQETALHVAVAIAEELMVPLDELVRKAGIRLDNEAGGRPMPG